VSTKGELRRQAEEARDARIYGPVHGYRRQAVAIAGCMAGAGILATTVYAQDLSTGSPMGSDFAMTWIVFGSGLGLWLGLRLLASVADKRVDSAAALAETKRQAREFLERTRRDQAWKAKRDHVPVQARAAVNAIRGHIASVRTLGAPGDVTATTAAAAIDAELNDLIERYNRVAEARSGIEDVCCLGDAELLAGLTQLEAGIVAKRREIAEAALNDLKVQSRFAELKHGRDLLS
jgi:hypothetical protein